MNPFKLRKIRPLVVLLSLTSLLFACQSGSNPTFSKDIAPLIHKNCSPCHHDQGPAPFPLLTYEQIAKRAKMIAFVTKTKYMPPWPADANYSHFINERKLSDNEIQLLQDWFENNCPTGDTSNFKIPEWVFAKSILGKPDLILKTTPIAIENNNQDKFYILKWPYQLNEKKIVRAVEFVPSQIKYVHHVNGHYLGFDQETNPFSGKMLMDLDHENFEDSFKSMNLLNKNGSIPFRVHSAFNYLPGAFGVKYPNGIGGFVMSENGAFVANDIHFGPSRKKAIDSSELYIYFSKELPKRPTYELMLGTNGVSEIVPPLSVPPNQKTKHLTQIQIFNNISVLTVNPHMHLIGSSFLAFAVKPNGDTIPLIKIPKWQFLWQYFYTFQHPVKIPKGSIIYVEAEFDNTAQNPDNPFSPPKTIGERLDKGGASMRTTDEMLQFIITFMVYQEGDEQIDLSK
jgi:hypothetical protein